MARSLSWWAIAILFQPAFTAALVRADQAAPPLPVEAPESPRIAALGEAIRNGDKTALGRFWKEVDGKTPVIEPIDGDAIQLHVTFLWHEDDQTRRVFLIGGVPGGDETLDRLEGTDLWYLTQRIPAQARFGYMFLVNYPKIVPGGTSRNPFPRSDPLNPKRLGIAALAEPPLAPPQPWLNVRAGSSPPEVTEVAIKSTILEHAPPIWVAHTAGAKAFESSSSLLVALDGETNGGKPNETLIPIPQIVENLKADQIPPTVVVLVGSVDGATRTRNLGGSEPFADFLSQELVPWVRSHCRAGLDPAHTVIAGQSHGGLAAAHAAFHHPDVFGCVLSQSGSFWYPPSVGDSHAAKYDTETGWLTRQFAKAPLRPVRFYLEVGKFEQGAVHNMVLENRRFRDVLKPKVIT